jgi:hypothetical protein
MQESIKRQDSIITLTVTLCVAIFTIGYYFLNSSKTEWFSFFMGLLGPSSVCYIGSRWIYLVHQQKCYEMYKRELEIEIKNHEPNAVYEWTLYSNKMHSYKKTNGNLVSFQTKTLFGQQVTLAMYLLVPVFMFTTSYIDKISMSFGSFIQYVTSNEFHKITVLVFIVVYVVFFFAIYKIVKKLWRMQKYIESLN